MTCDNWITAFDNLISTSYTFFIPTILAYWGIRIIKSIFGGI